MMLRQTLKARLCLRRITPNYPIGPLSDWASHQGISPKQMLDWSREVHNELEEELNRCLNTPNASSFDITLHRYWCFYCEQVQAYYKTILAHPENETYLWFLKQ